MTPKLKLIVNDSSGFRGVASLSQGRRARSCRSPEIQTWEAPARFERVAKAPGTLELVNGRFVEVAGD